METNPTKWREDITYKCMFYLYIYIYMYMISHVNKKNSLSETKFFILNIKQAVYLRGYPYGV